MPLAPTHAANAASDGAAVVGPDDALTDTGTLGQGTLLQTGACVGGSRRSPDPAVTSTSPHLRHDGGSHNFYAQRSNETPPSSVIMLPTT